LDGIRYTDIRTIVYSAQKYCILFHMRVAQISSFQMRDHSYVIERERDNCENESTVISADDGIFPHAIMLSSH